MRDTDLTEDQLFGYREDELPHIQAGTVMLIPEIEKERVLDFASRDVAASHRFRCTGIRGPR